MGTVRATPAYAGLMASDVSVGEPFFASGVPGHFSPSYAAPFYISGWSGKTDYVPMSPSVDGDSKEDSAGVGGFSPLVVPNGGVAPYTYSWVAVSSSGTFSYSLTSTTSNPCSLSISPANPFSPAEVDVKCTVTDGHSNSVDSNVAAFIYTSP